MIIEDLNNCTKKYSIVYTDPPWQQSRGGKKSTRPNSSGLPLTYKTMPLADIEELHRIFLRQCTEEKHNVFMWAIDKYLSEAEAMMKRLGYKLHARIVWDKLNGPSPFKPNICCGFTNPEISSCRKKIVAGNTQPLSGRVRPYTAASHRRHIECWRICFGAETK